VGLYLVVLWLMLVAPACGVVASARQASSRVSKA
jgi:hypothetical protein